MPSKGSHREMESESVTSQITEATSRSATGAKPDAHAARKPELSVRFRKLLRRPEAGVVPAAIAVFVFFSLKSSVFLTEIIWGTILTIAAELGIIAIFVGLLMIAGEFDLSVGSVLGLSAAMVPVLATNHGVPIWAAVALTLGMCVLIGLANAFLVVALGLPSLIVTIGGLMFYRGLTLYITHGGLEIPLSNNAVSSLNPFDATWRNINVSALWFFGLGIVAIVLLGGTQFGNWTFASGGNRAAALVSGVPVRRVKTMLFVTTSVAAGFAGILQVARLTSVDALRGQGYELQAILAVVIGGTALTGGAGGVIGTMLGVLILAMAEIGLVLIGVADYWYQTGVGLFLVLTVATNETLRRKLRGQSLGTLG
jgi:simple sugar transport system permease protein